MTTANVNISDMVGKKINKISIYISGNNSEGLDIRAQGRDPITYIIRKKKTCCEIITIRTIEGNIIDLEGETVLLATMTTKVHIDGSSLAGEYIAGIRIVSESGAHWRGQFFVKSSGCIYYNSMIVRKKWTRCMFEEIT